MISVVVSIVVAILDVVDGVPAPPLLLLLSMLLASLSVVVAHFGKDTGIFLQVQVTFAVAELSASNLPDLQL